MCIRDSDNVSCEYYPSDGICIMIDEHVCYANTFFDLVEESENGMIDRKTYMKMCIRDRGSGTRQEPAHPLSSCSRQIPKMD